MAVRCFIHWLTKNHANAIYTLIIILYARLDAYVCTYLHTWDCLFAVNLLADFPSFYFSLTPPPPLTSHTIPLAQHSFSQFPQYLSLPLSFYWDDMAPAPLVTRCSSYAQWQPLCCQLVVESPALRLPSEITSLSVYNPQMRRSTQRLEM